MSQSDSTFSAPTSKPAKPERPEGSPLYWHASGRWAKKIRGRLHYFGRGSHDDALAEYNRQAADLHSGRLPRDASPNALTVYQLCAKFLTAKKDQRDNGELSTRMFVEYADVCKRLIRQFGRGRAVADLGPDDFAALRKKMAGTWGPVRLKAEIIRSRTPFLWASKSGLIDRPPVYGEGFNVPTAAVIRRHKAKKGKKLFEVDEVGKLLAAASQPLKSMALLGLNCGFGNGDIAALPIPAVDLNGGWIDFARPKTGIDRRIPLWPETVEALRDWLTVRPTPHDEADAGLVFITYKRGSWKDDTGRALPHEFRKLADSAGIDGSRGFYCLRHTFQTIGDECGDFLAVRKIMGHATNDIADVYRERVSDERLKKVTDHIRAWALPTPAMPKARAAR
jgi:integrase